MTEVLFPPGTDSYQESRDSIPKRPGDRPLSISPGARTPYRKESSADQCRNFQQIVFDEAITIACDWFEATQGEAITEEALLHLHDAGYVSSTPAEILEIFYDWGDYQSVAQSYIDEREDPEVSKKALVASLRQEADMGLVPAIFFKKSEPYKIDNPTGKKRKLSRYQFTDEEASDDVVLQRYHKYLVADYVTRDRALGDEVTEDRKINIAIGFTQETGKGLSSFYGSLKNSNSSLTDEQIALLVEELDAYDYIYPDSRKKHLKTLAAAGLHNPKPLQKAEYYYDLERKKIILLGRTALQQIGLDEGQQYAGFLAKQEKLLIGDKAAQAYKTASENGEISPLAQILTTPSADFEKTKRDNYQYTEFDKDAYRSYGKWILSILDSQDPFVISVLRTASRLDIGPGEKAVIAKFGSIPNFFEQLGFANTSKRGHFAAWSFEDHVRNIQRIAQEIGGRPTPKILKERVKQGFAEPSVPVIKASYGFSKVMEAAGFPPYHQPVSRDELILRGLNFYDKNGRFPIKKDFVTGSTMGGYTPLYRSFSSAAEYHQVLAEQLNNDVEADLAA